MSEPYIVIRLRHRSGREEGLHHRYLIKQRFSYLASASRMAWRFAREDPSNAYRFKSLKMALHRVNTLRVAREAVRAGWVWEIVEITPEKTLAALDDSPLKQLARAAF